jgi:phenylalanyl-tRNA synthetase beta chain
LTIVCGAPNVRKGLKVIVALDGASLPGGKISKGLIRGIESQGMICSLLELGVDAKFLTEAQAAGIEELSADAVVGDENVLAFLGLDDTILDLKLLANRSDLYSILNNAKEIASLYSREVKLPKTLLKVEKEFPFVVSSSTPSCPQFSGRVIKNIRVQPSPKWLKMALQNMGVRSINNIVDIGNYIMLLTGQPLHMYDLDRLPKHELIIKNDYVGAFTALDGKKYDVQKGDIVITSDGEVMCLGGIMGSQNSAVDEKTKNIVVEVANFSFDAIRRTSTRLALTSDSSLRFVKGINPFQYDYVMDLATEMIISLCDVKEVYKTVTFDERHAKNSLRIKGTCSYINNRLGTALSQAEIVKTLTRDWIKVEPIDDDAFIATIPEWRIDIGGQADLSEEVIRIIGLDHIQATLPSLQVTVGGYSKEMQQTRLARDYLASCGLDEVLTYSLVRQEELDDFRTLSHGQAHKIINPLTDEHEYVRLSLLPSLLRLASYNLSRGAKDLAVYEVSDIDSDKDAGLRLAIVLIGSDLYRHQLAKVPYSFYHLKGLLEGIANLLGIKESRLSLEKYHDAKNELHPGVSAVIKVNAKVIGYLGELHPYALAKYQLAKQKVLVLDLDLGALLALETGMPTFKTFSRFPAVKRDLSLVVDCKIEVRKIVQSILNVDRMITNVDIFDVYVGEGVAENFKSVALTITYENVDRTLKDEEVSAVEKAILENLNKKFGIILRA